MKTVACGCVASLLALVPVFAGLASVSRPAVEASRELAAGPKLSGDVAGARTSHTSPRRADSAEIARRAEAFLISRQDASGGWMVNPNGPTYPAITGLVVNGMMLDPQRVANAGLGAADAQDPTADAIRKGVDFILKHVQPDGGIYDKVLPSYNTSICVTALVHVKTPEAKAAVAKAVQFLKTLQYGEEAVSYPGMADAPTPVGKEHAFYGGVGYGRSGRPDLSNTGWFLQALHDAGVEETDPAFQRALVFLQRTQMDDRFNAMSYAKGSRQGGFVYSTSISKDQIGVGQSMAGDANETLDDGTEVSRLRAYGSMTYTGFKSYLYAGLAKDDPRVIAARNWILSTYSVTENPGAGQNGLYYYYVVFARALDAWGERELPVMKGRMDLGNPTSKAGDVREPRRWADDLIEQLASLQQPDGSFKPMADRWLENDPQLITAYSLLALRYAQRWESRPVSSGQSPAAGEPGPGR